MALTAGPRGHRLRGSEALRDGGCECESARARGRVCVKERRGGRERFNIFLVTYEPAGEVLAVRLGPCVYQCGCIFLVCPTSECHGAWREGGLDTSL